MTALRTPLLRRGGRFAALAALAWAALMAPTAQAWEPTGPVELVVPAGTGGGADQMARFIAEMVKKHRLMAQPINVVNKTGNSGAEGFLDVKAAQGDPHKLIITLSNLFTTPLATGTKFTWQDFTPVQMMALDQFVLWVNVKSPFKSPKDVLDAMQALPPGAIKLGGTGTKQEDQLITVLLETAGATRLTYVSYKGGGAVAKALAAGEVDLTVNNPIEGQKLWHEGALRPLCVFDGAPLDYHDKIAGQMSWNDLPTCMSFGIPVQYLMLRGIFMTPGATPEQVAFYVQLLTKVRAAPEWKSFMAQGAFRQQNLAGAPFVDWLDRADSFHRVLMREAKFMAPNANTVAAAQAPATAKK